MQIKSLIYVFLFLLCSIATGTAQQSPQTSQQGSDEKVQPENNTEDDDSVVLPDTIVKGKKKTNRTEKESMHIPTTSIGSLIPVDQVELPSSVEILPERLIKERYATSFYETLELTSGVFTGGNSSFTRSSGRPMIRGFSGNDVLLNGLVLPNRMPIFLDSAGISGVEFFKGPLNSTLGGQGGLSGAGGAINIVGKMPDFTDTHHEFSLTNTFFNGSSQRIEYDPNLVISEDFALRIPLSYTRERPYYLSHKYDVNQKFFASPTLKWLLTDDTTVTFITSYQWSEEAAYQGIPYLKGDFVVPLDKYYGNDDTRDKYEGMTFQVLIDHAFTDELELNLGAGYARAEEDREHWSVSAGAPQGSGMTTLEYYEQILNTRTAAFSYSVGDNTDENQSAFAHLDYDLELEELRNQFTVGIDYLKRMTEGTSRFGSTSFTSLDNPDLSSPTLRPFYNMETEVNRYGFLAQDLVSWDDWRLLLGARLDRHESDSDNDAKSISPRVGLTYLIQPEFAVYGNYTLARGPNFGYTDINGEELTNSWQSRQIEAGIKKGLFDNFWATVAAFQITQENTPESDPADPTGRSYMTNGKNRSRGIEASLSGEIKSNWTWWGSYTYLTHEDIDDDIDFERYPKNSVSLWTSYRFDSGALDGLRSSVGYRYTDEKATTFRGAYISDDYMIDDASVFDLAFEYPLKCLSSETVDSSFELGVKNIFDKEYVESNRHGTENFAGSPRTVWARVAVKF